MMEFSLSGDHKYVGYDIYNIDYTKWYEMPDGRGHIHRQTGSQYDPDGYNCLGYDKNGFDRIGFNNMGLDARGFNIRGWSEEGIHRVTGTDRDTEGYDYKGLDLDGRSRRDSGYDEYGFLIHEDGYLEHDMYGFDWSGQWGDERGVYRDPEGYDCNGFNSQGLHRCTGSIINWMGFTANGTNFYTGLQYDIYGFGVRRWYA